MFRCFEEKEVGLWIHKDVVVTVEASLDVVHVVCRQKTSFLHRRHGWRGERESAVRIVWFHATLKKAHATLPGKLCHYELSQKVSCLEGRVILITSAIIEEKKRPSMRSFLLALFLIVSEDVYINRGRGNLSCYKGIFRFIV
jgi:hypothetical protein